MEFSAKQIAEYIQGIIVGDENATVHTFAKIEEGVPGAISFLSNPKYTHYIYDTQSTIVLVNKDFVPEQEVKATLIKVDNAYESLAKLLTLYEMSKPKKTGIDPLYLPNCLSNSEAPSLRCLTCSLVVLSAVLLSLLWGSCRIFRRRSLSSC